MRVLVVVRLALAAAACLSGFWLGDMACQYAQASLGTAQPFGRNEEPLTFARSRAAAGRLGISLESGPLCAGALTAGGALMCLALAGARRPAADIAADAVYGCQRMATTHQRREFAHIAECAGKGRERRPWPRPAWCERVEDDNIIMSAHSMVGASDIPIRRLQSAVPNRHVYVMAGSGAGKTWNWLASNIMNRCGSMVFTDPKGALFRRWARFLELGGYEVLVFDIRDGRHMAASLRYNPLANCEDKSDIDEIADMFIRNTKGEDAVGDQQYFVDMERLYYTAAIGLLVYWFKACGNMEDCTLPALIDYLGLCRSRGEDGLMDLDLVFNGTWERDGFCGFRQLVLDRHGEGALEDPSLPENAVLAAYEGFRSAGDSPQTRACVISSCYTRLQRLGDPALRRLLSRDELDLAAMGARKRALFLVLPDSRGPRDFLVSMLLTQLFRRNLSEADFSASGHLAIPVTCYLDELPALPRIPALPDYFATARERWLNLVAIVQDGAALEARYGKEAGKIRTNCALFVYLGASRFEDCEQLSHEMGSTTRVYRELSTSRGPTGAQTTESLRPVQVPLRRAEELYSYNELLPDGTPGLAPNMCVTHYRQSPWFEDEKPDPETHPRYAQFLAAGDTDLYEWAERRRRDLSEGGDGGSQGGSARRQDLPAP